MLLNKENGKIDSKTKLQKEIYFISLLLKRDIEFKAHYYGPYSIEVETALDELIGAGFVNVKRDIWGIDTRYGFEAKKYEFFLTNSGEKLAKIITDENPNDYETIEKFVDNLKKIENLNYLTLSIAAKAYFILSKESKSMTVNQIIEKASRFGWNINRRDIDIAVNILKELKFIK
ncbi:hypothetical protein DRQ09_02740 [candidate division KSB1 bacterium]|nr:MAG: hypothetical protein DRQ09_02740 [candidate division KSB1 bacterium]